MGACAVRGGLLPLAHVTTATGGRPSTLWVGGRMTVVGVGEWEARAGIED
jgi:hypothetical protein